MQIEEDLKNDATIGLPDLAKVDVTQAFEFNIDDEEYVVEDEKSGKWIKKEIAVQQIHKNSEITYLVSSLDTGPENCFLIPAVEPFHARIDVNFSNPEAPTLSITATRDGVRVKTTKGTFILSTGQTQSIIGRNEVISIGEHFKCYFTIAKSDKNSSKWELILIPLTKKNISE